MPWHTHVTPELCTWESILIWWHSHVLAITMDAMLWLGYSS